MILNKSGLFDESETVRGSHFADCLNLKQCRLPTAF